MCKTDLEIAQECVMDPILSVAEKIGLNEDDLEYYGKYKAKLSLDVLNRNKDKKDGKLILVTAASARRRWWRCVSQASDRYSG